MLPPQDVELVQIIDAALADAAARSGPWLACRPGCSQCCHGVFRMNGLDAERLRLGLVETSVSDPPKAERIRQRVAASLVRLSPDFPGDPATGLLGTTEADEEAFEDFANEEPCPVLDPATGTCDLYAYRPMTCRTFGPPVRIDRDEFGICELCFVGAPPEAVKAAEMYLPDPAIEAAINDATGITGETIVTFALAGR